MKAEGYEPVPVKQGGKAPSGGAGWQNRVYEPEDFGTGSNIGYHHLPETRLACADRDSREAVAMRGAFLPDTRSEGRASKPYSHDLYRVTDGEPPPLALKDGEMLMELRFGKGKQTLAAPSTHPSGERYVVENPQTGLTEIPARDLEYGVRMEAAACIIARHYAPPGGQYDFGMHLAGFLIGHGLSADEAERLMWAAKRLQPEGVDSDAASNIAGVCKSTAAKIEAGEPATGGRRLNEEGFEALTRGVARVLGWRSTGDAGKTLRIGGTAGDAPKRSYPPADAGNAERLVDLHGRHIRYVAKWNRFIVWTGNRWTAESGSALLRMARHTARDIYRDAPDEPDESKQKSICAWALQSQQKARMDAMISLARADLEIGVDELDADPMLFNCLNGTIDLHTGDLRPHDPKDLITKLAPVEYDPDAPSPLWDSFAARILPSGALRAFVQRLLGYALTGSIREHVLPVLFGTGSNGKTVIINTVSHVMGEYAHPAAPDLLLAKQGAHPTELADLHGARFVPSVETEAGRRFAEATVKQLTGGDSINARRMREDFWKFAPTHKIFLATNHKPLVIGTDHGFWRRLKLVPFTVQIPNDQQDHSLPEKLEGEASGILAWLVRGCLEWQRHGLGEPEEVTEATLGYRADMDVLAGFLADRCVEHPDASVSSAKLFSAWKDWAEHANEKPGTNKAFSARIAERGYLKQPGTRGDDRGKMVWQGIGLVSNTPDPDDDDGESRGSTLYHPAKSRGLNADPLHAASPIGKPNMATEEEDGRGCGGLSGINGSPQSRVSGNPEKPSTPSTPSTTDAATAATSRSATGGDDIERVAEYLDTHGRAACAGDIVRGTGLGSLAVMRAANELVQNGSAKSERGDYVWIGGEV
jgi:putative DNA primase/helicase